MSESVLSVAHRPGYGMVVQTIWIVGAADSRESNNTRAAYLATWASTAAWLQQAASSLLEDAGKTSWRRERSHALVRSGGSTSGRGGAFLLRAWRLREE